MDPMLLGLSSIVAVIMLILLGVPVAYTLGGVGILGMMLLVGPHGSIGHLASAAYGMSAQYAWAVAPLFVAIGSLASMAGITQESFNAARLWLGRLPGGLAMATTVASGAFAACSGSTVANAAMFTPMALPEMTKAGYNKRLSVGCIAAAGTFAAMIPPSITMVIYGVITGEPIGKLLIAGVIPGALTVAIYLLSIYIRAIRNPLLAPIPQFKVTWKEKILSLKGTWAILIIFLTIMVGIYAGWFAPSAAGAAGAAATLFIIAVRRKLSWKGLRTVSLDVVMISSTLFIIIIGGTLFARFWVLSGFLGEVSDWVVGLPVPPIVIVLMFMMVFIILGCFMDPPSMMVITLPIVYPIITKLGFSGIWFGILMIKAIEIAVITPPVGFNAYVVHSAAGGKVKLEDVFAGILPFLLMDIVTLAVLIAFPQISLWLPNTMK
jgi:C4-dicarboxylate transporter DctM subunit